MEFCPRCGTRLIHKFRINVSLYCRICGYERSSKGYLQQLKFNSAPSNSGIAILDKKALNLRTLQTIRNNCPICGGKKAETWTVMVGSEGASSVTFFRCLSCGHTRREIE